MEVGQVDACETCGGTVSGGSDIPADDVRRIAFAREETRFELGVLNDRINALISAEAFLTIAFTMAMGSANAYSGAAFFKIVASILSTLGLVLAVLAWPGVNTSYKTIIEWNSLLLNVMEGNPALAKSMWRPPISSRGNRRTDLDQRNSMLFARAVPVAFGVAWAILTVVAAMLPLR